jgi:hypothetical protein
LAEIHAVLDQVAVDSPLAPGEHRLLVADADRAIARLQSLKLKVVAAADKAAVSRESGMSGTGAWLASSTRATGQAAARDVALARSLEELPQTQSALSVGDVSAEHAAVIAAAHRQLPEGLAPDQVDAIETRLVEQARHTDPATLRKEARQALKAAASQRAAERHHDRVLRDEESAARARTRLTLHDNGDGTLSGHFTVPSYAGSILRKVIQQLASPRRGRRGAPDAQTGPVSTDTDWAQRYGQAFTELLEHLPTDRLHGKVAATVVVGIDFDQLTEDLRAAHLDTGEEISVSQAHKLACEAGILPKILDGSGQALFLGRSQRFFSEAQRVALAGRFTSCIAQGCDRPYAWCELHHRKPWSRGGSTDLDDAEPLCGFHHHRIHDPAYDHTRHADGSITFHRRT